MEDSTLRTAPEALIGFLTEQRDLYRKLQDLSDRQRDLIAGDRPEQLLNILRDRQMLVTALAKVNEKLGPYRRNWRSIYETLPDDDKRTASALLEEINGKLQVILQTDQEDQALLSARKQAVARSMNEVSGGLTANTAYARSTASTGHGASADLTG
jgi:hypothetical protein